MFLLFVIIVIQNCLNIEYENKHRENFYCITNYFNVYGNFQTILVQSSDKLLEKILFVICVK